MDPQSSPPDEPGIILDDPGWQRAIPRVVDIVRRAAAAAGGADAVVLTSDRAVRRLNARHRGQDRPTNVLSFEPAAAGLTGELALALGTVLREARRAGRRPGDHLAHLVVHGCLHLAGHDHIQPGDARRMEMAESRILARLGLPNPWRAR